MARLLAEFGVVVLGVTIALWADGRVAERRDRTIETARLRALQDNLTESLSALRSAREEAEGAIAALRLLVTRPRAEWDPGELQDAVLYGAFYGPLFSPEISVYEDLKNSGELALLTDPEVRRTLSSMESRLDRAMASQADLSIVQQLNLDTYLMDRTDLRPVMREWLGLEEALGHVAPDFGFVTEREFINRALFKLDLIRHLDSQFAEAEHALVAAEEAIRGELATRS
ncbi:MAG: hypothetical protein R3195_07480 [Gemmatimonadota bacterium]|nr:hypothetical protein [Gemmatimonadota bacterium]